MILFLGQFAHSAELLLQCPFQILYGNFDGAIGATREIMIIIIKQIVFTARPDLVKAFAIGIGDEHVAGAVDEAGTAVVIRGCLVNWKSGCGAQVASAYLQTVE